MRALLRRKPDDRRSIRTYAPSRAGFESRPLSPEWLEARRLLATVTSLSAVAGSGTFAGTATLTAMLTAGGSPLAGKDITFSLNGGGSVGSVRTDAGGVATLPGVSLTGINAGTFTNAVTASFAGDADDTGSDASGDLTVSQATPTITWPTPADIIYGTPLGAAQLDASASASGAFAYTPLAGSILNAGLGQTLSIQFTPADTVDYTSATASVTINVARAPLQVAARNAEKVYGQPNPAFTASYSGFVLGQDPTSLGGSLTFTTTANAASHVDEYPIMPGGLTSSNYAITFSPGTLFVDLAQLTIRADDKSKPFGAAVPALTASYSGFVNGDTPASFTTPLTLTTTATPTSPAGRYAITPSGATDPDYAIFFIDGNLTVTPLVPGDYNGDGKTDFALFNRPPRSATGVWYVQNVTAPAGVPFGSSTLDIPVQGDFNGDNRADIAVYRPSTAQWFVGGQPTISFGQANVSIPVPGRYDGLNVTQVAVYQPNTGDWYIGGHALPVRISMAGYKPAAGDLPVPADYDGNGKTEIAIYRPRTAQWFIQGNTQPISYGGPNDVPVPGDYDGVGHAELALFRPATQQWFVGGHAQPVRFGGPGDVPVPGDYDGVGRTQYVLYRPSTGQWFIGGHAQPISFGGPHMIPAGTPYAYWVVSASLRIKSATGAPATRLDLAATASAFSTARPAAASPPPTLPAAATVRRPLTALAVARRDGPHDLLSLS